MNLAHDVSHGCSIELLYPPSEYQARKACLIFGRGKGVCQTFYPGLKTRGYYRIALTGLTKLLNFLIPLNRDDTRWFCRDDDPTYA